MTGNPAARPGSVAGPDGPAVPGSTGKADVRLLPDVASRALGGAVLYASDEFYADAHNLIDPRPPAHDPAEFGVRGKIYDGWETRRRREPGEDFVIIRLAVPAIVRAVTIDTAHFRGNYPPSASVDGATVLGYPTAAEMRAAAWTPLAGKTDLGGDRANLVPVSAADRLVTHVRLTIHPDGGVARLRVYGDVVPDPRRLGGRVNLAATCAGGRVEACSNMFFSAPANALAPGRAQVMSDGWETARRRDDGHDWLVVRLAVPGVLHHAVIDTSRFAGNAPGHARLSDADSGAELLPRTRLIPDTEHRFRIRAGYVGAGGCPGRRHRYGGSRHGRHRHRGSRPRGRCHRAGPAGHLSRRRHLAAAAGRRGAAGASRGDRPALARPAARGRGHRRGPG